MRPERALVLGCLLALAGCGSDDGGATDGQLKLDRYVAPPEGTLELLVSVPEEVNEPATAGGRATVGLECFDERDRRVVNSRHPWPFVKDGQGNDLPHAHEPIAGRRLEMVVRCRLTGTDPPLAGEFGLAR